MFLDDLAAYIVLNGFRNSVPVPLHAAELSSDRICDPGFYDQLEQGHIIKWRNLPGFLRFDVCVD